MSCGLALTIALSMSNPAVALAAEQPPAAVGAPVSVAGEPLFADIVARSGALKAMVDGWAASKAAEDAAFFTSQTFVGFKAQAEALAALDLQGHLVLKERGTDGDLKCILRGISEDMPKKLEAVQAAATPAERATALSELSYLLNDNVEVITAPPQPEV
jgi:hypothetical protein